MSKLSPTFAEFAKLGAAPAEVPPPGARAERPARCRGCQTSPTCRRCRTSDRIIYRIRSRLCRAAGAAGARRFIRAISAVYPEQRRDRLYCLRARVQQQQQIPRHSLARLRARVDLDSPQPRKQSLLRKRNEQRVSELRSQQALSSILRIGLPSITAAIVGFLLFDNISLYINSTLDIRTLYILSRDNFTGQFIQNFLIVIDLLFAILAGERQHQTRAHRSTTPKPSPLSHTFTLPSLSSHLHRLRLHGALPTARGHLSGLIRRGRRRQIALRATDARRQGRPWYPSALKCMDNYITNDLRRWTSSR